MELHTINHWLSLLLILLAIEGNETSYNVTESVREPRSSRRVVKQYSGSRPDPVVCTDEGFQADPNNCAVFYRCMKSGRGKFTSFKFQCAPGTIYDPDSEVCNHPQNTKRIACQGEIISISKEPHENEVEGIRQEIPSPITTKKSIHTGSFDSPTKYPWMTTTSPRTTSIEKLNIFTTGIMKYPSQNPARVTTPIPLSISTKKQRLTSAMLSVTRQQNSQIGDLCTSEGFMGDSENCRKFYRCVGNQRGGFLRYEFLCSDTTIWDGDIQSCNHAWAVKKRKCGRGSLNNIVSTQKERYEISSAWHVDNKNTTPIQEQLQINYGSQVSQSQTQIARGLIKQNQTQINVNNRNETTPLKFKQNQTQISQGSAISQTQTQISYGNTGIQTQLQIDNSNESSQSQSQIHELSTKGSTTTQVYNYDTDIHKTSVQPGSDDHKCTKSGFMRDINDCKKFYRCVDNGRGSYIRYDFSCGEGTLWDSKLEACNHVWAVKDCTAEASSDYATVSTERTDSPGTAMTATKSTQNVVSSTQTMMTDENENDGYNNPNQIESATPSTTESTTLTTTTMSTTNTHSTKKPNINSSSCKTSGFVGDDNNCKKFYRCVDNGKGGYTRYEFSCGEGTVWDSKIEACNHAWAVEKCGGNSVDENIEATTAKETLTTSVRTTTKSQTMSSKPIENNDYDNGYGLQDEVPSSSVASSSTTTTSTSKQPQSLTTDNGCTSSGFMGDNSDCKKFYRCVDAGNGVFIRHEFVCGEGTVWDQRIDACNHAWAVEKCGSSSNVGIKEEVTTTQHTTSTSSSDIPEHVSNQDNDIDTGDGQQSQSPMTSSTTEHSQQIDLVQGESECKNSGFISDSKNCKKFYRCVDNGNGSYTRYEFTCGEGTVWDPKIEACNHYWAVDSCGENFNDIHKQEVSTSQQSSSSTQSTLYTDNSYVSSYGEQQEPTSTTQFSVNEKNKCKSDGFMGDKNDCKKFYRCVENGNGGFTRYEFTCGDGTVWNQDIQTCDHDSPNSSCGDNNLHKEPDEKVPAQQQDEMYIDNTTKDTASSYDSTEAIQSSIGPSSGHCKSEGFYGNPDDCKKFYRCVDNGQGSFTKYDFTCGDGTMWDQEIQACNHESSNKCVTNFVDGNTVGPSSSTTSSTTSAYTEQEHSSEINHVSEDDKCTSEGFFANSNDCKKFHRCVSNEKGGYLKYEFSCAEGTVWVQEIQSCDYEDENMNCLHNISTSKPQSSQHEQTSDESQWQTSTASNVPDETDIHNDEYPDNNSTNNSDSEYCSSEGFYPNPKDCKKFYRCVDNGQGGYTKYDFNCGEGTAWDSEIQNCNHISEVKGCQNAIQEDTENKPLQDEVSQATDTTGTTTTESNESQTKDICKTEGYFGNTQNCKKFYRCVDNGKGGYTKYDYDCGEGTIWDQDVTTCNHPQDVQNRSCRDSDSSTSAPPSTSTSSSSTTSSSSESQSTLSGTQTSTSATESSNQNSTNCSQETSSTKPVKEDIKCEKAGYYANPSDCKKFYRCVDWDGDGQRFSVYHFDCGDGTIWDPQLETCNHEESVYPPRDCSGSQSQNENIQEPSKEESPTTTESTTLQSTTSEQTTTQQSTSSEETTTQQSTTSEMTTTQKTSTEQTTTHQSTTSTTTQTTTQQSTTTESTSTQQSTTTDSTIQQTTTTDSTTSRQPTTDSTTTEQTTTSEGTTTSQSTTTDGTTTQHTTTAEGTTTEQSTTSESTTTEQSTTQGTTTQQSATTEQTSEASEQSTTQESTTEQTTQETTNTDETTTQQLVTTEESTTKTTESTNDSSTTEESSTEQQTTTEQSSNNQSTTEESTTQATDDSLTTGNSENTTTEPSSTSSKECPDTDDDQYLYVCPTSFKRHPKYCNMFYQCTEENDNHELNIAMFTCPNNTIYDESKTQCVEEDKADKKCDGEIAQKRRFKRLNINYKEPIVVGKQKHSCPVTGYFPFEENTECSSVFMKCQRSNSGKLRGYVHRCPEGYIYWSISKRCEKKENLKDCKRSGNDWSRRWEIPVEHKNVAM